MKKFLIPVFVMLTIFLGGAIFAIYLNYSDVQYDKDLMWHMMSLEQGGELTAEYNGQTVRILGSNIVRVRKVVGISDKERFFKKPEYDEDEAIYLNFSNGAEFVIFEDDSQDDAVFVLYNYKRKNLYFNIQGYKSWEWAQKAISPEGISSPNEIIE